MSASSNEVVQSRLHRTRPATDTPPGVPGGRRRAAQRVDDAHDGRLGGDEIGRDRRHRLRRLVLVGVRHRQHPGRRHLDRHKARMRGVHQREADVVVAQQTSVLILRRARQQLDQRSATQVQPAALVDRPDGGRRRRLQQLVHSGSPAEDGQAGWRG